MSQVARQALSMATGFLRAETGLAFTVAQVAEKQDLLLAPVTKENIVTLNVAPDVEEKTKTVGYPRILVYCENIRNLRLEKFRTFAGKVSLTIEVRVSQDRLDDLNTRVLMYVDAITDVLDSVSGDWGGGFFFGGCYEASMGPTRHGGRNFIQSAKVSIEIDVSVD